MSEKKRGRPTVAVELKRLSVSVSLLPSEVEFLKGEDAEIGNVNQGLRNLLKRVITNRAAAARRGKK